MSINYALFTRFIYFIFFFFFFQAEDGIRDHCVTGVQTCALPISRPSVTARCTIFSLTARQISTLMPYFFSNAWPSGVDSVGASEVYSIRLPSRFASWSRRGSRSAPLYRYTVSFFAVTGCAFTPARGVPRAIAHRQAAADGRVFIPNFSSYLFCPDGRPRRTAGEKFFI